jgi:hypothetical protein
MVLQYNKRDLPGIVPVEELQRAMNPRGLPWFEAVAVQGIGVKETLKAIATLTLSRIGKRTQAAPRDGAAAGPSNATDTGQPKRSIFRKTNP